MKIKGTMISTMMVALIIGVLAIAGGENLSRVLGVSELFGTIFVIIGVFIMGLILGFIAPSEASITDLLLCAYGAIVIGDFVDILIDWFFRSRDRNLWPLEIIVLFVLAFLPIFLSIKISRKISNAKQLSST
jgi:hypothetical protein